MAAKKSRILTALLVSSISFSAAVLADPPADVEQVLVQAEVSLGKAREAGNSWSTTEKLIAAARQADDQGEAMELAQRALLTADKAREQQTLEQDAWQPRVPSN